MRIVIGGQIERTAIADLVKPLLGGKDTLQVMSDLEASMAMQSGQADYYLGACNTGGGGALAMAIALLGMDKCATLGMPGKSATKEEIEASVQAGKVAFGFTSEEMPLLWRR